MHTLLPTYGSHHRTVYIKQATDFSQEGTIKTHQHDIDIRSRLMAARLPSMPQTLLKLMEQCQSADVGMRDLLRLVAQDAAMSAKMLSVANSSAYHRSGPTGTLEQSLQTIGTEMIKAIVINESVSQVFDKMSKSRAVDLRSFWMHSLQAGLAARIIAQKIGYSNSEEAYLSGLLHDVGRLVLYSILPREYGYNFYASDNDDLCAVEERTMQTTHAEVGSWLIEQWKLDSFIADSVLYHHEAPPRLHKAHPLIRITHLAHAVTCRDISESDLEKSGALCALRLADLLEIRSRVGNEMMKSAEFLDINLTSEVQLPIPLAEPEQPPNDPAQDKMMEQVRGLMLASALEQSFAHQPTEIELLETVAKAVRILFQLDSAVVLLMNPTADALVGSRSGEHRHRLADFTLPLNTEGSTIAQAALDRQITFTPPVNPMTGVFEEQLVRLFETEHLVCLPLNIDNTCLGMLLGGFKGWQSDDLQGRIGFLKAFSNQAALALNTIIQQKAETEQLTENLARGYREASRKVAHEVNNPLSIIKNYLSILDRKILNKDAIDGEVAILNEEINRVGKIIDDFVDVDLTKFSGKSDVGNVIKDVVRLFRQAEYASPLLQIENRLQNERYEVDGNSDTLKQIFVNLVKNAAEAMTGGGLIEIGSDGLVNRDGVLYVDLWVKDAGPGIAPEIMSKLFTPVQSSKGRGHRGLGLNIVHELVKKMQGQISCRSTKQGTTFEILLPVAQRAEHEPATYS